MIELILNVGAIFLIYILLVTCINLFMYILFYRDRDLIEIKLPVRKKFKTSRLSPLYKLTKSELTGTWYINKYEVGWGISENSMLYTVMFIPFFLINWRTYKYHINEFECYVGDDNDLEKINSIEKRYEFYYEHWKSENSKLIADKDSLNDKVKDFNKTFDENYVK